MAVLDLPPDRRRRFFTAGSEPSQVRILSIEVTQAIQSLSHSVRLVAGKQTVVRVYLEPQHFTSNIRVRGEVLVSKVHGGPGSYVTSINDIALKASNHPTLIDQHRSADLSLNFLIPTPQVGGLSVRLNRLIPAAGGQDVPLADSSRHVDVNIEPGIPLRVRAIGLRYTDSRTNPVQSFAPEALHFNLLRSFLTRVYPVSEIKWSQIVVPAHPNFVPPFSGTQLPNGRDPLWEALLDTIHQFLARLRQVDINAGMDPRTHYYGLVADDSGFFRGAANDIPATANPAVVSVGPVGRPRGQLAWDTDESYGDWYGAHELAHTFGRFHPGFCGQDASDQDFPYPNGQISLASEDIVGFNVGDATLGLLMRAYPHENWHDVMTYCDNQWISKYTYDALYTRLQQEDTQFAPETDQ